ncbi:MAG: DegT/DnrJ/EryC1/StrS family aminotransferase [Patescibacteria group bacterium]
MNIPVSKPLFSGKENEYVSRAIRRTEISGTAGEFISRFENDFASYCECKYGVATTNGTTAIHLALATLGISDGDEVLVSTFTNMATFFAVLYQRAKPIPVDIEEDTWNLNPALLEERITSKTKAIIVVHIYGHPVDMDPVFEIAKRYNLFVIEDAAEAHGALYKGKKIGSLSDIACFSFYANKILTTGEGGMITTNNKELAKKARVLQSLAYGDKESRFMHVAVGFNYRMTNFQAAVGCAQLENIEKVIELKRNIAAFYQKKFGGIKDLQPPVEKQYAKNVYWMYLVVLRGSLEGKRKLIMNELEQRGIQTREAFTPANMQRIFIEKGLMNKDMCPIANRIGENGFYLPSGPEISEEELLYVTSQLDEILMK